MDKICFMSNQMKWEYERNDMSCQLPISIGMWFYYHLKPYLYCGTFTVLLGPEKLFFPTSDQWITLTGVRAIYLSVCWAVTLSLPQGPAACHQTHMQKTH